MMYMRIEQAARFLDVSASTIRNMIKKGVITDYRKEKTLGFPGPPAVEISAMQLAQIKEDRDAEAAKPSIEKVTKKRKSNDEEVIKLLQDLQAAMVLQAECLGKLLEKLI